MNLFKSVRASTLTLGIAAGVLMSSQAAGQTAQSDADSGKWQFTGIIYGWLPTIGGKLSVPVADGGASINVDAKTIIDHLKMGFIGALEAHNGRWGAFTDVLYLDIGGSKSNVRDFSIGNIGLPASTTADLSLDLKATVWTVAGEYRVISDPAWKVDVLAGARLLAVKPTLGWSIHGELGPIPEPDRSGSKQIDARDWDGIVAVKGRYAFGENRKWFMPFYLDVGTGQSQLTWQAAGGVGYAFHWGEVLALWRYLDYNFKSGKSLDDLNFNGPMFGAAFHW